MRVSDWHADGQHKKGARRSHVKAFGFKLSSITEKPYVVDGFLYVEMPKASKLRQFMQVQDPEGLHLTRLFLAQLVSYLS